MKRHLLLLALSLATPAFLHAWDADDETFDPSIRESIIDGAARIGDPSPFHREGYEKRGFTYVGSTIPEEGIATVNLSFILPPDPSDPAKDLGGAIYLPVKKTKALIQALEKGAELSGTHDVLKGSWNGDWTLSYDEEKGLVVLQDYQDKKVGFSLSIPAAKKLAGALKHSLAKVENPE